MTAGDGPAPPGGSRRVPDSPDSPPGSARAEDVVSLDEILRAEATLDALAARRGVPAEARDDPAAVLLAALAHDVDPPGVRSAVPPTAVSPHASAAAAAGSAASPVPVASAVPASSVVPAASVVAAALAPCPQPLAAGAKGIDVPLMFTGEHQCAIHDAGPRGGRRPRSARRARALVTGLVAAAAVLVTVIVARPSWPASGGGRGPAPLSVSLQPAVQRAGQGNAGGARILPGGAASSSARTGTAEPGRIALVPGPGAGAAPRGPARSRRNGPVPAGDSGTRGPGRVSSGPSASSADARGRASAGGDAGAVARAAVRHGAVSAGPRSGVGAPGRAGAATRRDSRSAGGVRHHSTHRHGTHRHSTHRHSTHRHRAQLPSAGTVPRGHRAGSGAAARRGAHNRSANGLTAAGRHSAAGQPWQFWMHQPGQGHSGAGRRTATGRSGR